MQRYGIDQSPQFIILTTLAAFILNLGRYKGPGLCYAGAN